MLNSTEKADLIAKARGVGSMYVTQASPGENDSPERILFDAGKQTPKEMVDAYAARRAQFDTIPLDPEGNVIRLYRGQWTIFSGYTGTGKTTCLRQMVCHLLKAGKRVFIATLEQDPEDYIVELAATAAGVDAELLTEKQMTAFLGAYGAQIKLWGVIGVADHRKILATVRDLGGQEGGLDYAILDSLMMLDIDESDIEEQRKFAALLTATSITSGVHVVLVAHPKKPMDPEAAPSTNDVSGSAKLGNLCYNMLFIRRGPPMPGQDPRITTMQLHILKQRTRGIVGELAGCFYRHHNQFHLDAYAQQPHFYLPADYYPATGLTEEVPEHILNKNAFRVEGASTSPWDV